MEIFAVGDEVKFKDPEAVRAVTTLHNASEEVLHDTHMVTKVEPVPTKCDCGAVETKDELHQTHCGVYATRNVGHPQWIFTTAEPGGRWSAAWFTHASAKG